MKKGPHRAGLFLWVKLCDPDILVPVPCPVEVLAARPRALRRSPRATPRTVISKIVYLRQNYHFGAGRIAVYLQRFHQVKISRLSVHRILVKNEMGRSPANQKHQPHHSLGKKPPAVFEKEAA